MKVFNLVPSVVSEPGRLSAELSRDKQKVILRIFEEITRCSVIMGINVEAQSAKHNAVEVVDFIKKQWPYAHIDDICQAIKMGAYGQLRFEGQLSTLSASNIYQWYKEFRMNHQDKMVAPPPAPPPAYPEITDNMKKTIVRESFESYIDDPEQRENMVELHYDRLVTLGLKLSNQEKIDAFNKEMHKIINNPPIDLYKDKKGRMQIREIQHYWDDLEDKTQYNYNLHSLNPLHKMAVYQSKVKLVNAWLKTQDKKELMKKFDEVYG